MGLLTFSINVTLVPPGGRRILTYEMMTPLRSCAVAMNYRRARAGFAAAATEKAAGPTFTVLLTRPS